MTCFIGSPKAESDQIASPKGLLAGLDLDAPNPTALVPAINNIDFSKGLSHLKWILVIEKEVGSIVGVDGTD